MLDMGFELELREILMCTSKERQSLLFSATFPKSIQALAKTLCYADALHLQVGSLDQLTGNKDIFQHVTFTKSDYDKTQRLKDLAYDHWKDGAWTSDDFKMLVFCKSKRKCGEMAQAMTDKHQVPATELHGDLDQRNREWNLRSFQKGDSRIMFATDVASRGLDIKNVILFWTLCLN